MEDRVVCSCLDVTYNTIKEAIENGAKMKLKQVLYVVCVKMKYKK